MTTAGDEWIVESCDWIGDGNFDVVLRSTSGRAATDSNTIRRARRRAYKCDPMGRSKHSAMLANDGHRIAFRISR